LAITQYGLDSNWDITACKFVLQQGSAGLSNVGVGFLVSANTNAENVEEAELKEIFKIYTGLLDNTYGYMNLN
jgi:hypothetical protein